MRRTEEVIVRFDDQTWERYCREVIKKEDWNDFKTSDRWFERLEISSDQDTLPESTRKSCEYWMPRFLVFTWKTPDQLIEDALIDSEIGETLLSKFATWMKSAVNKDGNIPTANSVHIGAHGYIRGFYKHNKINTHDWYRPKYPPSQVKQTDAEYPIWLIKKDENKKMSASLNRPGDAILYILLFLS